MEIEEVARILAEWARQTPFVENLWLFGSRLPGGRREPRPDSDLDVAVDVRWQDYLFLRHRWNEQMNALGIPWRVHLCHYNSQFPVGAEGNIRAEIDRCGLLVFRRDNG
jgi:predicted nucleotidyltransferase